MDSLSSNLQQVAQLLLPHGPPPPLPQQPVGEHRPPAPKDCMLRVTDHVQQQIPEERMPEQRLVSPFGGAPILLVCEQTRCRRVPCV